MESYEAEEASRGKRSAEADGPPSRLCNSVERPILTVVSASHLLTYAIPSRMHSVRGFKGGTGP